MQTTENPQQLLESILGVRRSRNPSYSLRALARDLGVSHSFLSMVRKGSRVPSIALIIHMAGLAQLSESQLNLMLRSLGKKKKRNASKRSAFIRVQQAKFRMLSQWYYPAILDLTHLKQFRSDEKWVAHQLGVSIEAVKEAVIDLETLGFLERKEGHWKKSHALLSLPTNRSHETLRRYHKTMIHKALDCLESSRKKDYEARDISGSMIPVNAEKIEAAKEKVARFRQSLIRFLSDGECTKLYHLNVQLFPLTGNGGQHAQCTEKESDGENI